MKLAVESVFLLTRYTALCHLMGENCGEPLEDAEALLFSGTAEVDIWFTSDEMLCRLFVAGGKVIVNSEDD